MAEQQYLASTKLRPCVLEGCNDVTRVSLSLGTRDHQISLVIDLTNFQGLMRIMHGLDRTAHLHSDAVAEAEEACNHVRALSRELAEFKEVHSAIIDSLKCETTQVRDDAIAQRQIAETAQAEAEVARAEAKAAREELTAYKGAEAKRHETFLKSREFKEIIGPIAYKFLKIGCQGVKINSPRLGSSPRMLLRNFLT